MSASSPTPAADPTRPLRQPADALHWTVFAVVMLVTVAADQLTKKIARDNFSANDPFEVLPFLQFTKTWNTGIAFGAITFVFSRNMNFFNVVERDKFFENFNLIAFDDV